MRFEKLVRIYNIYLEIICHLCQITKTYKPLFILFISEKLLFEKKKRLSYCNLVLFRLLFRKSARRVLLYLMSGLFILRSILEVKSFLIHLTLVLGN